MLIDLADTLHVNDPIKVDFCVIGAGVAGITLAHELAQKKFIVGLIEGGDIEQNTQNQQLYDGQSSGTFLSNSSLYPLKTRTRCLGGTSNQWTGSCEPLTEDDLHSKDWIHHSGWPLLSEELFPYYQQACDYCDVPLFNNNDSFLELEKYKKKRMVFKQNPLITQLVHVSPPTRFGTKYLDTLIKSPNIKLILNANFKSMHFSNNKTHIREIKFENLKNLTLTVEAKFFILACGGLENARILLQPTLDHPLGVGNEYDIVGRYFMEHASLTVGQFCSTHEQHDLPLYRMRPQTSKQHWQKYGYLTLHPSILQEYQLLKMAVEFYPILKKSVDPFSLAVGQLAQSIDSLNPYNMNPKLPLSFYHLRIRAEQVPNRNSRIELTHDRDRLGQLKIKVLWELSKQDIHSIHHSLKIIAHILGKHRYGRIQLLDQNMEQWPEVFSSHHHMGTTRMGSDPKTSVVDSNLKVHSTNNLFITGSSVFPTSGVAYPTLTITALSIRLAEYLKNKAIHE